MPSGRRARLVSESGMAKQSTLRFGAQTDEVTSFLRIVNMVRTGEAATRPEIGRMTGLGRGVVASASTRRSSSATSRTASSARPRGTAPRTLRFRGEQGPLIVCALGPCTSTSASRRSMATYRSDHRPGTSPWTGRDARGGPDHDRRPARATAECRSGASAWAFPVPSTSIPAAPSRRRSCPAGTASTSTALRAALRRPRWVDNDVNLLTLGERARRGDDHRDLIYCKIGSGIGAGLLSRGHSTAARTGRPATSATCASRDRRRSAAAARSDASRPWPADGRSSAMPTSRSPTGSGSHGSGGRARVGDDTGAISIAAEAGDALAIWLIQRSARIVGESIAALVNMFNPAPS